MCLRHNRGASPWPPFKTVLGLTATQFEFFRRDGYLVLNDLFGNEDLQPAIDDINRAIDTKVVELSAAGVLSRSYAEFDFEHRLAQISRETDQVAMGLWNGVLHGPGLFELITNPKLLDVAESLCGEELVASSVYRLRPKIPLQLRCRALAPGLGLLRAVLRQVSRTHRLDPAS